MNSLVFLEENWNFTLANYDSVWNFMVQMGLLLIFLFIGNMLRNLISPLRKSLIPSALIGGVLLLGLNHILMIFNIDIIDRQIMQVITYHGLGIGFVAMTLKSNKAKDKKERRETTIKAVENGFLGGGTYILQAIIGLSVTIIASLISSQIFYACGIILPLGFGQGPGNALTWDVNFSSDYPSLFTGNGSFGLSIASIGFIVASLVGVIYINVMKRKGLIRVQEAKEMEIDVEQYVSKNEIPDSESIDKFSIQLGLVFIGYAISFAFMVLLGSISNFTNSIAWGFNFLWGVFAANLIKLIINFLKKKNVVKRNYVNNYQMDRISGFAFDIMIVAGVAAIEFDDIKKYWLLILILCVLGTIFTYLYIRFVAKKIFKDYEHEVFVLNFGVLTGTASNGLILLKEIDPNLETPASKYYIMSQVPNMLTVAPLLLLIAFSGKSLTNSLIALGIFIVLFIGYNIFLFRKFIFKKKKKVEAIEEVKE